MSVVSVNIPEHVGISVSPSPVGIPVPGKSPNEWADYKVSTPKDDAVGKCLDPISENVRNKIRMCPESSVFSNSEYVYAIFPISIALFWGKGGEEICRPRPLSLIFAILSHCLNTTAVNNYSIRTIGKWSCGDTVLKGSPPLAHPSDFERPPNGPNARIVGGNPPRKFYRPLLALTLETLRFKKMSLGTAQGRENLYAIEFPESELAKKAPNR